MDWNPKTRNRLEDVATATADVILVYEDDKENCYAATAIADI